MTLPDASAWDLAALAAAVVAGEFVTLRVGRRMELPASYAVAIAVLRVASVGQFLAITLFAHAARIAVQRRVPARTQAAVTAWRMATLAPGAGAFLAISRALDGADDALSVTVAGGAATTVMTLVAWVERSRSGDRSGSAAGLPGSMLALGASGTLMALAYRGTGDASLGGWSLALFTIPVLATRYALAQVHAARQALDDTVTALSAVPELGGLVPAGDADRLADLAVAVGRKSGLHQRSLDELERAARVHHLGYAMVEDIHFDLPTLEPFAVARATATLVRDSRGLETTERLLRGMAMPPGHQRDDLGVREHQTAQVLRVVTAFHHLSEGRPERAGRALDEIVHDTGTEYESSAVMALARHVLRGFASDDLTR